MKASTRLFLIFFIVAGANYSCLAQARDAGGAQAAGRTTLRGRVARVASTWRSLSDEEKYLTTDSRGVYRIGGLPAGEYVVRASESNLSVDTASVEADAYGDGSLVVSYFPSAVSVKDAAPVRVYEGRDTDGVDIRMPDRPVRGIAGCVTLKRGGGPVAGADIMIDRKDEGPFRRHGLAEGSARTDAEGRWELRGVPDGQYVLTVNALFPVAVGATGAVRRVLIVPLKREVTVSGADLTDLKIEVEEGGIVSGTVSIEGGRKFPALMRIEAVRNGEEVDWTVVRDNGQFEVDKVPAGEVRLRVEDLPENRIYVKSLTWNQVDLTRAPLRVAEGTEVSGVLVDLGSDPAKINGRVLNPDDRTPTAAAVVLLVAADESLWQAKTARVFARADAAGEFSAEAAPGDYLLFAWQPGDEPSGSPEAYIRSRAASARRVSLKPGANPKVELTAGREK